MFISFEGIDGTGKSTQIQLLKNYFEEKGKKTCVIRDPGSTNISEKLRDILLDKNNGEMADETEMLIYAAARCQMVNQIILPNLKDKKIILCDRYIDSSIVYQGITRGLGIEKVLNVNKYIMPDITFLIDLSVEESLIRKNKQKELDRIEKEDNSFHKKVRDGYLSLLDIYPKRIKLINGNNNILDINYIIIEKIEQYLKGDD